MRTISTILMMIGAWSVMELNARSESMPELEITAAIHAIQQAPDPSAAVAAYANALAIDRNSAAVQEAYVSRMIDFGLPEMAYRQARTLTGLAANNGLAWGVLAYVDARRGDMTNAVAGLNLAGRFAPEHPFVQRTAGEILAWYDLQADRAQLPDQVKAGLERVRTLLAKRPVFVTAYDTAKKAYQSAPVSQSPGGQGPNPALPRVPSLVETNAPQAMIDSGTLPPPDYYPSSPIYAWDSGPIWVEPDPIWWWYPVGFFSGAYFVPYSHLVFNRHHHQRPWDYGHGHPFAGRSWDHSFPQRINPGPQGGWHHNDRGQRTFYGPPAQPSPAVAQSAVAAQPSWSALGDRRAGGAGLVPAVRPPVKDASPSWSAFSTLNRSPASKSGIGGIGTAPGLSTIPASRPSWSTLESGWSSPRAPAPLTMTPSPAPSWSNLGRGAPASSAPFSGSFRSGSAAPARGGGTSWSVLGGSGRH